MSVDKPASRKSTAANREISSLLIDTICRRLAENKPVRRTLPEKGRLHIDRQLPFLCVYRRPPDREDPGTERLVKGEASYLIAPGTPQLHKGVAALVRKVVETLSSQFGAFLIIELWAAPDGGQANDPAVPDVLPTFTIHAPRASDVTRTVETLETHLKRVKIYKQAVNVEIVQSGSGNPATLPPLIKPAEARRLNCSIVGLAVPPVYRMPKPQKDFPLLLRSLRRSLSLALRRTYFEFVRSRTTHRPPHYHALGRHAVVKAVWDVDRQLADVSTQFDYLLQLTPINTRDAWNQFRRHRFERAPQFHYRPLPVDPAFLKRELYRIPIDRIEDPALLHLFQQKQEELELKLSMLRDRDTRRFLYESLQLFGPVDDGQLRLAKELLRKLAKTGRRDKTGRVNATRFAQLATAECDHYRRSYEHFKAKVEIRDDVSSLIVSRGKLLVNADLDVSASRVESLLAHEVGTHLLTYYNGRAQPFKQLCSGLAGYEELQEGLAVLAEYLAGGISRSRMRQLAARVLAVRSLIDGASFVEVFRILDRDYGFNQRTAYRITMRVFRGGGLTKDAVYLRGLEAILKYLRSGGDLEMLLVGKMAVEQIPIIRELAYRKVLIPAPLEPRYLQHPSARQRLRYLRDGKASVLDLVSESTPTLGGPS